MRQTIITDTGVFVALLDKTDNHHEWAKQQTALFNPPFVTCEAVITESSHLLKRVKDGQQNLLAFVEQGFVQIDFSLSLEFARIQELMKRYENVPMSLADACLVRMSEQIENSVVFTLDSDFWIYRKNGNEPIDLIIP